MLERVLAFWSADAGIAIRKDTGSLMHHVEWSLYQCHGNERRPNGTRCSGLGYERALRIWRTTYKPYLPGQNDSQYYWSPTEEQVGNPLTHPGCGFSSDDWVLVFKRMNSLIPLNELGPDHESWGHKVGADGFPAVFDRARQSKAYAEAGSFGKYLIQTYGINKMKKFHELSRSERPWQGIFGMTLQELEANWLKTLQADEKTISTLSKLFERSPDRACLEAQKLVTGKQ
jgi:hypothetical protein